MAIEAYRRTVTTVASVLYANNSSSDYTVKHLALINASATQADVVLGPLGVTAATGARWTVAAGKTLSIDLQPTETLYAIVASGSQDIDVLVSGR